MFKTASRRLQGFASKGWRPGRGWDGAKKGAKKKGKRRPSKKGYWARRDKASLFSWIAERANRPTAATKKGPATRR